jgi:hypothetical protein
MNERTVGLILMSAWLMTSTLATSPMQPLSIHLHSCSSN